MYNVDGVMIDIGVQSEKATSGIEKLANTLGKLKGVTHSNLGLDNVKNQLEDANKTRKKWSGFAKTLIEFSAVKKIIGTAVTKSNEYVENMNLFRVALGRYADEAQRYSKTVERVMGIDSSEWMRNQGTFMQIATGFGMAEDQAYKLSKALTQVSYDIASFYNISTEQAMLKVRSGIAGELEPLRNLGYALDTATLQQIAYANGINMKVTAMTQAQKAELRYVAIMSQSKNAINDMSRTYSTSANQIRVLASQINVLARAFGNILIPAINAALPVIIMFVNALSTALNAIAGLFGFVIPSVDWSSGIGEAGNAAGELGDNIDGATGGAKKLKRVLMGFDELNVMPDVGGSGGGGGGGSVGGYGGSLGLELEDYMYDFLDGMYAKVNKINGKVLGIVAAIAGLAIPAATMLDWKDLSNYAGLIVTAAAQVALNFKFTKSYLQTGNATYLLGSVGVTSLAGGIFTTILRNAGFKKISGKEWKYGFAAALALDAGVTLAAVYDGVVDGDIKSNKELIASGLKTIIESGILGFSIGGWKGAVLGLVVGAAATIAVNDIAVGKRNRQLDYGQVTASAEEIRSIAERMLNIDVDAHLNVIVDAVDGVAEAETKLDEAVAQLQTSSNLIRLGIDTSDEAYQSVMSDAQGLIAAANTLLSEQERSIGVLLTLSEPTDKDGNSMHSQLQSAATNAISALRGGYASLGNQLMEAIQSGMDTGEFEAELISNLSGALTRVSSAVTQGEIMGGYVADVQLALGDLDKESFDSVMQEVQNIQNELRASYTELAQQNLASMQGNLNGLRELQNYYYNEGNDKAAGDALSFTIKQLEAAIASFDIQATVDAMMANATAGTDGKVADALVALMVKDGNSDKFGDAMLNFITNGMTDVLRNGDYGTFASGVATSIEGAFLRYGIDLSSLGFTGLDFMTDEFRSVIDNALRKTGLSQETIDQMWEGIARNPVWGKVGKEAAQESIAAIKSQYENAEPEVAPTLAGVADTIASLLYMDISNAATSGDYSGVVNEVIAILEQGAYEAGIDISKLPVNGVGLLTDTFREQLGNALSGLGVPQNAIDDLWNTLKSVMGDGIITSITDSKTGAVRAMNDVIADIKRAAKSSTIKLKFGVDSDGSSLKLTGASGTGIDIKVAQTMASGGTVDYGTMFIAGEAGPEIVGRVGNKTGVVNRGQISEIISSEMSRNGGGRGDEEAIARAVASALSNVRLAVDGDDFGRIAVKTINARRQKAGRVELIL